ncbi:MAG TPA: hypothetical protein VGU22_02595 [Methylomirabilota bacterium]|nr:hypothetical protein [Methylomirabilota bacterium]
MSAGRLGLGQFQRIVLLEFEGRRERTIEVDVVGVGSSAPRTAT